MPAVRTGLDVLVDEGMKRLAGKRVALLGNPVAVDRRFVHLMDRCLEHNVQLVRLFGPEHGLLGDAQDMADVKGHKDPRTDLEVISLYGTERESLFLNKEQLEGVDVLVCDLQDVGSRYYTFSYTIAFAMRACREAGVTCMVLDRPNPIGGTVVEGNLVRDGFRSFVGEYALPNRPGLTMGELCTVFREQDEDAHCDLEVVWMDGWRRDMHHDETGAPWVMPSPNMPTPETALVYPGGCLFEGTNLSEGRGTTRPFELVGAPYIDDPHRFAAETSAAGLEGVRLRPCWFRPTFQKHAGELCGGVQLHVTDRSTFRSVRTSVAMIAAARRFDGFDWRRDRYEFVEDRLAIDLLFGDDRPRMALESAGDTDDVMALLAEDSDAIAEQRARALHAPYGFRRMKFRALYGSEPVADAAAVAQALGLAATEGLPDRLFVFGEAGHALAHHVVAERETSDEAFIDDAAAFLLEAQRGRAPQRPDAPAWLERTVVVVEQGAGLMEVPHARRGLEMLGRIVVMAAPGLDALEPGEQQNANVWVLGGSDEASLVDDEGRLMLAPGDFQRAGGVLDFVIRRGVVTATVTREGETIARLEHQLRASTKMSVQG